MRALACAARLACLAAAIAASALPTRADTFPSRPVKVIVQTAAGSSLDVLQRIVNEQLSQIWGKDVIVVNQAGAGGLNAARLAAAAAPDGYTLFLAGGSVFVALPELHHDLPFDVKDFAPIGFVADEPYSVLVSSRLAVRTIPALIAASKEQPGGLNAVAGTVGGLQHLTAERFRLASGAHLNMIHYPGTAQSLGDVVSGRVPVMFQNLLPVAGVVHSGEVRMLAIAASARLPNYPTIPTVAESLPGFTASGWSVMVAPPGTPPAIVQKINGDLRRALQAPVLVKKFQDLGNYTIPMSPTELSNYIAAQRLQWRPIVQKVAAQAH